MGADRRIFIHWDSEIDGAFRRRLERAFGELQVDHADASQVDHDPDAPAPVKLAVISAMGQSAPSEADVVVLGGPGEFHAKSALRLEAHDIETRSKRWVTFAEKLGAKIGRPALAKFAADAGYEEQRAVSLAFPADPLSKEFAPSHAPEALMEKAAAAEARAEAAERAVATAQLNELNAIRDRKSADAQTAAERARVTELQHEVERLSSLSEATAFALAYVPEKFQDAVKQAREDMWRAKLVAARAAEAAAQHPDALLWKSRAAYSGETLNRKPHGFGVMVFREGDREVARYAGAFAEGRREGHGVATSDDGLVWTGAWRDDEGCGHGLLEAPDGSRFEGEVAPDESGAPKQVRGWVWDAPGAPPRKAEAHRAVTPALPSPQAAGG